MRAIKGVVFLFIRPLTYFVVFILNSNYVILFTWSLKVFSGSILRNLIQSAWNWYIVLLVSESFNVWFDIWYSISQYIVEYINIYNGEYLVTLQLRSILIKKYFMFSWIYWIQKYDWLPKAKQTTLILNLFWKIWSLVMSKSLTSSGFKLW